MRPIFGFVLLVCTAATASGHELPEYYNVGVMYSIVDAKNEPHIEGLIEFTAIKIAFDHINNKTDGVADDLLPDVQLRMVARSPLSSFAQGAADAIDMLTVRDGEGVISCVGPATLKAFQGTAPIMEEGDIPVLGYNDRSSEMGNSANYPNVLRTVPGYYYDAWAMANVVHDYFGWGRVTVLYSNDNSQYGSSSAFLFNERAELDDIHILSSHAVIPGEEEEALQAAKKFGAKIFVLFFRDTANALTLLQKGHEMDVFGNHRQILGGEYLSIPENWEPLGLAPVEINTLLHGFVGVRWEHHINHSSFEFKQFLEVFYSLPNTNGEVQPDESVKCDESMDYYDEFYLHQTFIDGSSTPTCAGLNHSMYSEDDLDIGLPAYDAVFTVAHSMHALLYGQAVHDLTPAMLHDHMLHDLHFEGLSGGLHFDNDYKDIDFNVGGRSGYVVYRVVNYHFDSIDTAGEFQQKMIWTLEEGVSQECDLDDRCHEFDYYSSDGSEPLDRPHAVVIHFPYSFRIVIEVLVAINLLFLAYYGACVIGFRKRRFVKITQPNLTHVILLGATMIVANSIVSTGGLNVGLCSASNWLDNIGFATVYMILALKLWRVQAVSGAMTKTIVTVKDVLIRFAAWLSVMGVVVMTSQIVGIKVNKVTTIRDQFTYEQQLECAEDEDVNVALSVLLHGILAVGLYFCYLTRHINSSLSNVNATTSAIMTAAVGLVFFEVLDVAFDLEPIMTRFVEELITLVVIFRVTWVLYFDFCLKLILGTDLDRSLHETKTSWTILQIPILSKLSDLVCPSLGGSSKVSRSMEEEERNKKLAKFSKLKNEFEMEAEIRSLTCKISDLKSDLACLENMRYSLELSSDSSARSSQAESVGLRRSVYHSIDETPPPVTVSTGRTFNLPDRKNTNSSAAVDLAVKSKEEDEATLTTIPELDTGDNSVKIL